MASPESNSVIDVMVCLATVTPPRLVNVQVPAQATVADAVRASGLLNGLELTIDTCRLGIYGKRKTPDAPLHPRDRVEILGPLIADDVRDAINQNGSPAACAEGASHRHARRAEVAAQRGAAQRRRPRVTRNQLQLALRAAWLRCRAAAR